ncbi:hypothetical protein LZ30DRAFT_478770 [Colletotrichum cereale]|nr:hypothetical protein LZ30DRAFT_478770 [Colletotrichum cereale]
MTTTNAGTATSYVQAKTARVAVSVLILIWIFWLFTSEIRTRDTNEASNLSAGPESLLTETESESTQYDTTHGLLPLGSVPSKAELEAEREQYDLADSLPSSGSQASKSEADPATERYDVADAALLRLCNKTQWTTGLWLSCHSNCGPNRASICGGVNNARNRLQSCLRLAIEIGAGVIFPYVTQRSEDNIGALQESVVCPSMWLDTQRLTKSMGELCPGMHILPCEEQPKIERVVALPGRDYRERPHFNGTFNTFVTNELSSKNISIDNVTHEDPLLLRFGDSHIAWDYRASGELATLRKALFRVMPFNKSLLSLGNAIFSSKGLLDGNFVGIHLRAESDWPSYWGTPARQMEMHAAEIRRLNAEASEPTTSIYVSCGDKVAIQNFRDIMSADNYTVHDKWTLLADRPDVLETVDRLTFDQKAVVEYSVLVRGRYFQGNLISTMSSIIAYTRTMDQPDFFKTNIYPDTQRWGLDRFYHEPLTIKGDEFTKEFVINGQDIMDAFP